MPSVDWRNKKPGTYVGYERWNGGSLRYFAFCAPPADGTFNCFFCTGGPHDCPFRALAEACEQWLWFQKSIRKTVVISYYAHPWLAELYPAERWTTVDCARAKHLSNQARNKFRPALPVIQAPEVLIVNGPSFTQETKP